MFISSHSFHKDTDNTPFSIIYTDKFRNIWKKSLKCIKAYLLVYITVTSLCRNLRLQLVLTHCNISFWKIKLKTILTPANPYSFFLLVCYTWQWSLTTLAYLGLKKKMNFKSGVIKIYTRWRRVLTTKEFALAHQNDVTFAIRVKARLRQTRCHQFPYLWKDRVAVI